MKRWRKSRHGPAVWRDARTERQRHPEHGGHHNVTRFVCCDPFQIRIKGKRYSCGSGILQMLRFDRAACPPCAAFGIACHERKISTGYPTSALI